MVDILVGEFACNLYCMSGSVKRFSDRGAVCFLLLGFAFVYMEDERDAEDAIRALDRIEFGRKGRRLRVEWTKVIGLCCIFFLGYSMFMFLF